MHMLAMLAGLAAVALAVAVVAAAAANTHVVQSCAPWKAPPLVLWLQLLRKAGTKAEPWFRVAAKWAGGTKCGAVGPSDRNGGMGPGGTKDGANGGGAIGPYGSGP